LAAIYDITAPTIVGRADAFEQNPSTAPMFDPAIAKEQLKQSIDHMSELDFARFIYCQHMAAAHLSVGLFEHMLTSAMLMCDRVKVERVLGADVARWEQTLRKHSALQGSTIGSLIKILERHGVAQGDIAYLKWVKEKRDYLVHRLFHDGAWPGDLDAESCGIMTRRLIAIQRWLSRAERQVWLIFERAGFVELKRFDGGGVLAMNPGVYDELEVPEG